MKYLLPLATLLMTACLDSDELDTGDEAEEEEVNNFSPSEGLWTLPEPNMTLDTCGFSEDDEGGEDTDDDTSSPLLTLGDDGAFTIVLGPDSEDSQSLACTLDAQNFTCGMSEESPMDGMDAVLTMEMNLSGSFSSADAFTGGMGMDMSCTGPDCAMLAEFGMELPCSMEGDVEGTFAE